MLLTPRPKTSSHDQFLQLHVNLLKVRSFLWISIPTCTTYSSQRNRTTLTYVLSEQNRILRKDLCCSLSERFRASEKTTCHATFSIRLTFVVVRFTVVAFSSSIEIQTSKQYIGKAVLILLAIRIAHKTFVSLTPRITLSEAVLTVVAIGTCVRVFMMFENVLNA